MDSTQMKSYPHLTPTGEIEHMFLNGMSIQDICTARNFSTDMVEDVIRKKLQDWRFKAHTLERYKKRLASR